MDALQGAVVTPPAELVVDVVPGRQIVGQVAPGAAVVQKVQQGVDDFAQVMLARAARAPVSGLRQTFLERLPLGVTQVSGVGFAAHPDILHHLIRLSQQSLTRIIPMCTNSATEILLFYSEFSVAFPTKILAACVHAAE